VRVRLARATGWLGFAFAGFVAVAGSAANSTVAGSRASLSQFAVTPNDLKPAQCAGIMVTNLIVGSGTVNGSNANDLILGGPTADSIAGGGGSDCIVGGGGNDNLRGDGGDDVILGGPGADTINGGAGYDVCYGGPGFDSVTCESWPDFFTF